jgi:hypothetical protein
MADHPERAATLMGFADGQRDAIAVSLPPADVVEREQVLAALEAKLGSASLAALRQAGRRLSLDEALRETAPAS